MSYKSRYKLKNPDKYIGDPEKIIARSSWERAAFSWCERNENVIKWSSEELIIVYLSQVDKRVHRYFPDLFIEYGDGRKVVIEIKPASQTIQPKKKGKRYLRESLTYIKNVSKWQAAKEFCRKNDLDFEIWTEHTLKSLGIRIVT